MRAWILGWPTKAHPWKSRGEQRGYTDVIRFLDHPTGSLGEPAWPSGRGGILTGESHSGSPRGVIKSPARREPPFGVEGEGRGNKRGDPCGKPTRYASTTKGGSSYRQQRCQPRGQNPPRTGTTPRSKKWKKESVPRAVGGRHTTLVSAVL